MNELNISLLSHGINLNLFLSTFALIFVAELPDKTFFATLLLATRKHPFAIFTRVAAAFVVQSLVAVTFGSALSFLLSSGVIRFGSGVLFLVVAFMMWVRKEEHLEAIDPKGKRKRATFLNTVYTSFATIFIAEWGDLTQLSTAALAAKYNSTITIFTAATLALWMVTALAILIGHRAKTHFHPQQLQRVASIVFAVIGLVLLAGL
jgi:putative Ca2+/H+ antiporter (TMEM165/GDT1 family)